MPDYLELHGCRHDILGHYLMAIGRLRVLAKRAGNARWHLEAESGRKVSTPANFKSLPEATTRRLGSPLFLLDLLSGHEPVRSPGFSRSCGLGRAKARTTNGRFMERGQKP